MGVIRYISDLHLGHENMAIKRGFKSAEEQDKYLIKKWNSVVKKRDTVWILGDISMEKSSEYYKLNLLNGLKKIILGNHDKQGHARELLNYSNSISGMVKITDKEYGKIFLTHCPIHESELNYRVKFNIHGHIHENLILGAGQIPDKRYINVCCERIDYSPKTLEELFNLYKIK
jgi:calcineurin-like phosphoesterase family protein